MRCVQAGQTQHQHQYRVSRQSPQSTSTASPTTNGPSQRTDERADEEGPSRVTPNLGPETEHEGELTRSLQEILQNEPGAASV